VLGGVTPFSDPALDDGLLEVGVVDAQGVLEWGVLFARTLAGEASASKFARETKAHRVKITLSRKEVYELDGGDRKPRRTFKAKVVPGALEVCVPG
jgi:diacylglycerol kinase family enzyme